VDTFEEEPEIDLVAVNLDITNVNEEIIKQEKELLSMIDGFAATEENAALIDSMRLLLRGGDDE